MPSRRGMAMSEMTKDQEALNEHENAGRRRLVRGVAALAPLVLTIRSGGLAAASAGGAAIVALADVDKNKNINNVRTSSPSRPVQVGDKCVVIQSSDLNGARITGGKVDTNPIFKDKDTNTRFKCGDAQAPQTGNQNITVAILSSFSATNSL